MARKFYIYGETLVYVKFTDQGEFQELGMSSSPIEVIPRFIHQDKTTDSLGPEIPVEIMWQLADCRIAMNLIHYDDTILQTCVRESMGGKLADLFGMAEPGTLMMNMANPTKGHTMVLGLRTIRKSKRWRFPSAYLAGQPLELPLGLDSSVAALNWRAVPAMSRTYAYDADFNADDLAVWQRPTSANFFYTQEERDKDKAAEDSLRVDLEQGREIPFEYRDDEN